MEILAFPYAYGSANIYTELKTALETKHNFHAFDYPGHASRIDETPLTSISAMADDAIKQITPYISKPYCLLGYSMGGKVVFEIYQKLKRAGMPLPSYMFILASHEPSWVHKQGDFEHYDLEQVKDILREQNGTSEEILREDELISLLSPAIIADSIALRDYTCNNDDTLPVDCGITIIRGDKEEKIGNCREEWEKSLKNKAEYLLVDGKHFFLFQGSDDTRKKVINIIAERISQVQ